MNDPTPSALPDASERALAYHERTKHRLERYARGPETLDWSEQPKPFREFAGCRRTTLPLRADHIDTPYALLDTPTAVAAHPLSLDSLSALLELSFGLSAWKSWGPDRWAVRCTPSSGNLHPTEAYVFAVGIAGLADGLYHYRPDLHGLELRCAFAAENAIGSGLWIGLSSIIWREAWKYGERAFRYCQLDAGHALSALRYASATLGWSVAQMRCPSETLTRLLGLDRGPDFSGVESETAELLLHIQPMVTSPPVTPSPDSLLAAVLAGHWHGKASLLDPNPMYHWPVLDDVALATQEMVVMAPPPADTPPALPLPAATTTDRAAQLIRQRRSAQQFDRRETLPLSGFCRLLEAVLEGHAQVSAPHLNLVLFVHRVAGLTPGVYFLMRTAANEAVLRSELDHGFAWQPVHEAPSGLPLYRLTDGSMERQARQLCCHQAIAADSAFVAGMLAEFEPPIRSTPAAYRSLHQEAGALGQTLYLEAEALGQRGTGIGCFFDDELHASLGLESRRFQVLYLFTIGTPVTDARIASHPPYHHRNALPGDTA